MTSAPSLAAVFSVAARLPVPLSLPSTTMILQYGQAAEIIDTSSVASMSQPVPTAEGGSGADLPRWLTTRKQPLATVQGGRPNCLRYTARYWASFGVSKAIDTATV